MDTLIKDLITMGGPLGVLVVVVWIFVRDRHVSSTEHRAWMDNLMSSSTSMMKLLHEDHLSARKETQATIRQNTEAMIAITAGMRELGGEVNKIK